MTTEGYPSREDRIVAEFGDGHDVEGIAFRHGLTVAQVYAVIEQEVAPAGQVLPYTPPAGPAAYQAPHAGSLPDEDGIVAEYGEGHDVEWIALKHGVSVERVYEVVQRIVANDPRPAKGPATPW